MLKHVLEQMRDAGQVISLLEPFSWDYYRRFGWEWIGARRRYAVPARILKPDPETERVRAATAQDRSQIVDAYTRFAERYRGMVVRTDKHWARILDDSKKEFTYTYLYEREGQVEGYLTYRGGKGEETGLREFISLTPRAQRALLGLLRRHEMQVTKFTWSAPPDDGLWSRDYHWDIETKVRPQLMGRVVDVPAALCAWKPAPSAQGRLTLGVQDDCAPWNTATWQIDFADGQVEVRPNSAAPQVSLDIQALSQAYFGTPTVAELRAWERLQVHDEAGYQAFTDLLAGTPMWINDGF
jgi:predicted acetyltransferase